MGRITDAWNVLLGRNEFQIRKSAQLARIEAEWTSICSHIQSVLENLNSVDVRLRKREERARKRDETPAVEPAQVSAPRFGRHTSPLKTRKRELREARQALSGNKRGAPPASETIVEALEP